jgi:hypothetical protein
LQEVQEEEAVNHIKAAFIEENFGASSENSNNKQPYLIKDIDGSMIDARPLLASLHKNILNKCASKTRIDKVKCVLNAKDNECDNNHEHEEENDTQTFTLGSFGAFCFEDANVSGGFRFWIGQIDKILKVRNGKKERIFQRIELTAKTQQEILLCCSWLEPLLPADAGKDEVLTAKEYVYCPSSENREYISAEYLRYIVQMEDSHQKQYKSIDPDDLEVLGNIIAAKASEDRQLPPTQQHQPMSVESTTEQSTKRRRKKSNNADDLILSTPMEEGDGIEGGFNSNTRVSRHGRKTGTNSIFNDYFM